MKKLLSLVVCSMVMVIPYAQNNQYEKIFVRIFDQSGTKIAKGKILSISDEEIYLSKSEKPIIVSMQDIGLIKTKRSAGNNVLIGAGTGVVVGMIAGAASAEEDSWFGYNEAEGASGGGLILGVVGAGVGGITAIFKNQKSYPIDGDPAQWEVFKASVSKTKKTD